MSAKTEFSLQFLINPTLAIKTGSSALVKSSNAFQVLVANTVVNVAASDMPALTGTIPTAYTSTYAFQVDSAGALTVVKGNNVLTATGLSLSDLPATDRNKVTIGLVTVVNATGSTFTGGTTALDTASLTVYYSNVNVSGL